LRERIGIEDFDGVLAVGTTSLHGRVCTWRLRFPQSQDSAQLSVVVGWWPELDYKATAVCAAVSQSGTFFSEWDEFAVLHSASDLT
jgi:hypothetical protein